jgi:Glycosyl hydrolase family 59/Ricin-type beta-trefoil lectin domain-like/Galactocerebrosidase, C-terminal lectin domain
MRYRYLGMVLLLVSAVLLVPARPAHAATTITIDGNGGGRTFDGIGAISGGGGNSRLLIDYPEPYRSQILDYLFTPNRGASLQLLKVEIGGDMNSTDGAEPSIMHTGGETPNFDRGYEWWLMEQAKARNPDIKLAALSWGAPGWLGDFWSQQTIDYIVTWLTGAKTHHGLTIDYIGGWNENGYDKSWFENLRRALDSNGLGAVKIVGADSGWDVADDMAGDTAFRNAVDIVGAHYPCEGGDGGSANSCGSPATAKGLGKPLWASENGSQDLNSGAAALIRSITLGYAEGRMTAYLNWPLVAALPPGLPFETTGLIVADQPWSGAYRYGRSLWATAQVTQFTKPGWSFIDSASGLLGGNRVNGSYITLKAPDRSAYSTVIETTRATAAQTFTATVTGGLPTSTVHVWSTDLGSSDTANWFVRGADITPNAGRFSLTLQPNRVYTITTTTGQGKSSAAGPGATSFPLPYSDNFDAYPVSRQAKYLADEEGAFEVAGCGGGRGGNCLRQMAPQAPIYWHGHDGYPWTILGDSSWRNYTVSADVLFEQSGTSASLLGRYNARDYWEIGHIDAYYLRVTDGGSWSIRKNTTDGTMTTLASGTRAALGVNTWHRVALSLQGSTLTASVDGATLGSASDGSYAAGPAGLAVGAADLGWKNVQFDNLSVTPGAASQRYKLLNRNSGKALAVNGGGTADGATIVQWTDNGTASQQWELATSGGYTQLVNIGSGKVLDVPGSSVTAGTQLIQWSANGGANQQWSLNSSGGYVTLVSRSSGMLADVSGASTADGTAVIQWPANGGANQQWLLVPA